MTMFRPEGPGEPSATDGPFGPCDDGIEPGTLPGDRRNDSLQELAAHAPALALATDPTPAPEASSVGLSIELELPNPSGLHARPAATFVRACAGFRSDIRLANVSTGSAEVTAKSIIAVLGLGVCQGHLIRLRITGEDETEAAEALRALVEAGLGEAAEAD